MDDFKNNVLKDVLSLLSDSVTDGFDVDQLRPSIMDILTKQVAQLTITQSIKTDNDELKESKKIKIQQETDESDNESKKSSKKDKKKKKKSKQSDSESESEKGL